MVSPRKFFSVCFALEMFVTPNVGYSDDFSRPASRDQRVVPDSPFFHSSSSLVSFPSPTPRAQQPLIPRGQATPHIVNQIPLPTGAPSGNSGSGSSGNSPATAAIIGGLVGAALGGLSGGVPLTGGNGNVGGSGPAGPNAGGIENGSDAAQRFNPNQNKEVADADELERESETDTCELECPAEDPGIKGDPNDVAMDSSTKFITLQAGDQLSQGAADIASAIGAAPPQVYTTESGFLGAVTAASADSSGQSYAIFINSHGAANGGLQAGTSAQEIADAYAQGGGKNENVTIIHSECYAGEHSSQIAYSLEKQGFDQSQRPNQIYSRPAYCKGYGQLNGEQLHQGGYGLLDQAILQSVTPGQPLTLGEINAAAQGISAPGYTTWIKRGIAKPQKNAKLQGGRRK